MALHERISFMHTMQQVRFTSGLSAVETESTIFTIYNRNSGILYGLCNALFQRHWDSKPVWRCPCWCAQAMFYAAAPLHINPAHLLVDVFGQTRNTSEFRLRSTFSALEGLRLSAASI